MANRDKINSLKTRQGQRNVCKKFKEKIMFIFIYICLIKVFLEI